MPSAANTGPTPVAEGEGANRNNSTSQSESQQNKRDLASWWKQFKRSEKKGQEQQAAPVQGIFGVPLSVSIRYANVAISLFNEEGRGYIYGYVPIVVAKCGVFLKEKATDVEGIFRLAGSEKRIKELKVAFDSPDRYGKGLDWTGYTVHDAANILRRYFNQLPEPIIPLGFYDKFRDPLRGHEAQAVGLSVPEAEAPGSGFDVEAAIKVYQVLITELPPLNRQLLLYILDLLAVFASKSDLNKMTTSNLAAIFQPGLLSHPQHDMAPQEYRLSQDVLIFLIENQDSFLIGMPGTAADQQTVEDVQSGAPSPGRNTGASASPTRSKTVLGRSSSNASNGTEGRWSTLRRNVSVSSKQSKQSGSGPTPLTPASTNAGNSGVQRSNTVPSRRAGSASHSPRFSKDKGSGSGTHSPLAGTGTGTGALETPSYGSSQNTPIAPASATFSSAPIEVTSASSSEATTPLAGVVDRDLSSGTAAHHLHTPRKDTTPLLAPPSTSSSAAAVTSDADRSTSNTPSSTSGRGFLNILKQSPSSEGDGRKPNKLQKKRMPGSALSSAHSSSHDLGDDTPSNPISQTPVSPSLAPYAANEAAFSPSPAIQRNRTDATVRRAPSPSRSAHSHTSVTDQSDADMVGDDMPAQAAEGGASGEKQKRRHRWRFSRSQNKLEGGASTASNPLGTLTPREQTMSKSTIGSQPPRRGSQEPGSLVTESSAPTSAGHTGTGEQTVFSDSEREKKGPLGWIRGKIHERKEKEAEKRAKSPEHRSSNVAIDETLPVRGTSSEAGRGAGQSAASTSASPAVHSSSVPAASTVTAPEQAETSLAHPPATSGVSNDKPSGTTEIEAEAPAAVIDTHESPANTADTANITEANITTKEQ